MALEVLPDLIARHLPERMITTTQVDREAAGVNWSGTRQLFVRTPTLTRSAFESTFSFLHSSLHIDPMNRFNAAAWIEDVPPLDRSSGGALS